MGSILAPVQVPIVYKPSWSFEVQSPDALYRLQHRVFLADAETQVPEAPRHRQKAVSFHSSCLLCSIIFPFWGRTLGFLFSRLPSLPKILLSSAFWKHGTISLMSLVFFKTQDWLPSCNFYHSPVQLQTTSLEAGKINRHNCKVKRGRTLRVLYIRFSRNACWDYVRLWDKTIFYRPVLGALWQYYLIQKLCVFVNFFTITFTIAFF